MDWVCVYRGNGPADAHLMQHWLVSNRLQATVRGEALGGLAGAIPVPDSWPTVWVPEDSGDKARELITAFQSAGEDLGPWTCPRCAEPNEPAFGSCWNCWADRPDVPAESPDPV